MNNHTHMDSVINYHVVTERRFFQNDLEPNFIMIESERI